MKSVGSAGLGVVKVTTTGLNVPGVNAGMFTIALTGVPTTVIDCVPVPALTWSMVTEPGPLVTPKEAKPPVNKSPSVTVVLGVQVCDVGVGVGFGVGLATGVGDATGVGVGDATGVGVGVGVGATAQTISECAWATIISVVVVVVMPVTVSVTV